MNHRATRRPRFSRCFVLLAWAAVVVALPLSAADQPQRTSEERRAEYFAAFEADREDPLPLEPMGLQECIGGFAGPYPCEGVDLLSFLSTAAIGGGDGNDVWGWTDPLDGKEYALMGRSNGTSFVDVTDPLNPVYLGNLPSHTGDSTWRDIKTHANHAFIVSDLNGSHGMQVFDLTRLRNVPSPPATFTEDAWYNQIGSAHNVVINEDTAHAFIVGGSSAGSGTTCSGGLHVVDISNPTSPAFEGCFSSDGYTHDAQCVTYNGPDTAHVGDEICFNSNEDTVTIVEINEAPFSATQLSRTPYAGSEYTHQNWLTEDHKYLLVDDELDEQFNGHNTYTYVWDVSDLESPQLLGHFTSPTPASDHNQYIRGNFAFQSNYRSGLRILRFDDLAQAQLTQVGYFDTYPANDSAGFSGTWSNYPYFASGNVLISNYGSGAGLFVVKPTVVCTVDVPTSVDAVGNGPNRIDVSWVGSGASGATFTIERALGGCGGTFEEIATGVAASPYADTTASGIVTYGYRVREVDESGFCVSDPSLCVEASTTGACTAPPAFAGIESAVSAGTSACRIDLAWSAASPFCNGPARFNVYRSETPDFDPTPADLIAGSVGGTGYEDWNAPSGTRVYYVVRAFDLSNGSEESNSVHRDATATGPIADGTFTTGAEPGDPTFDTLGGGAPPDGPEHVGWQITGARAHSGANSFWSTSSSNLCVTLEGDVSLTAGQSSELRFWTAYDVEFGWDGGVIDLSTNGGGSWTRLTPAGGYPGSINNSGNACGLSIGTPVFNGSNLTFQQKTVDLAAYSGQDIRLRWQYSSDGLINGEGWYVDDVEVTHAQIPGACSSALLLFADHEEGDTSDWSSTVP